MLWRADYTRSTTGRLTKSWYRSRTLAAALGPLPRRPVHARRHPDGDQPALLGVAKRDGAGAGGEPQADVEKPVVGAQIEEGDPARFGDDHARAAAIEPL